MARAPRLSQPCDTLEARWDRLEPHMEVVRPEGAGPFPVVLLFHGCGGRRPFLARYMAAAAEAGVMALSFNSFAPRGLSRARALVTVCTGAELPGWRRAGDVLAAVWGARRMADVDPGRLALAGWSHGGWAIMDLMTMALARSGEAGLADPDPDLLEGVAALFLAYPYCGPGALTQLRDWRRSPATLAIVGGRDRVAHPALSRRALRIAARGGAAIETWAPPTATHAFDEDGNELSFFRFDPALAAEAEARMARFLSAELVFKRELE